MRNLNNSWKIQNLRADSLLYLTWVMVDKRVILEIFHMHSRLLYIISVHIGKVPPTWSNLGELRSFECVVVLPMKQSPFSTRLCCFAWLRPPDTNAEAPPCPCGAVSSFVFVLRALNHCKRSQHGLRFVWDVLRAFWVTIRAVILEKRAKPSKIQSKKRIQNPANPTRKRFLESHPWGRPQPLQ